MYKKRIHSTLKKPKRMYKPPSVKNAPEKPKMKAWVKKPDDIKSKWRSSQRWKTLRDSVFATDPLCRLCGSIADHIHHIEMDFDKFWERDNLVPICESCHIKTHESYIRLGNAQGAKILFKTRNYTGGVNG